MPSATDAQAASPIDKAPSAQIAQFFIPAAASLQERRPRTLKHGDTFALFDHNGDALAGPGNPEGLYHRDTRYLSYLHLTIGGARPLLLSSTVREDNATLTCDLTNPDLHDASGRLVLGHDLVHIRRLRFLWNATCFERLAVRNFDDTPRRLRIEIGFAADFADIFEVRGAARARRGDQQPPEIGESAVVLSYSGLDGVRRQTRLRFEPRPVALEGDRAVFEFELQSRAQAILFATVECEAAPVPPSRPRAFMGALRDARRALRKSSSRGVAIATANDVFNECVRRSVSDLYTLITDTSEGPYPYAGIPWFSTVFGRDGLITALQTLWFDPTIAKGVLGHLSANQATAGDPAADADPGKILHEIRYGEMAELREVPFRRYYGSIDSTPLFLMLAGAYLERTGDVGTIERLCPSLEAALDWIDRYGDRDGDGFIEYGRRTAEGLLNQGWKDSYDSVFHADGTLAEGPIAICEVQAYAYGALRAMETIARRLGKADRARELGARAERLCARFDEAFFDDELGTYVLALDGEKRPCRVRASNAGHALYTGIALPHRAERVVSSLMAGPSFSGWGVRTLAASEARYNPMSYHNGSVWPHDNALIAAGFARYGYRREAARIFEGLFDAATYIDLRRLPELFCGFARQRSQGPTFYPVACSPQAWAAVAPLSLLQSCLGLGFDAERQIVMFDAPLLPEFASEVRLSGLSIGSGRVDVAVTRAGGEIAVKVLARSGEVRVTTTV